MKHHLTPQNGSGGSSRTDTFFVLICNCGYYFIEFYKTFNFRRGTWGVYRIPGPAVVVVFPKFYYYTVDQSQSRAVQSVCIIYYRAKLVEVK